MIADAQPRSQRRCVRVGIAGVHLGRGRRGPANCNHRVSFARAAEWPTDAEGGLGARPGAASPPKGGTPAWAPTVSGTVSWFAERQYSSKRFLTPFRGRGGRSGRWSPGLSRFFAGPRRLKAVLQPGRPAGPHPNYSSASRSRVGKRTERRVPWPGAVASSTWPPSKRARSRMPSRPNVGGLLAVGRKPTPQS